MHCGRQESIPVLATADRPADRTEDPEDDAHNEQDDPDDVEDRDVQEDPQKQKYHAQDDHEGPPFHERKSSAARADYPRSTSVNHSPSDLEVSGSDQLYVSTCSE